MSYSITLIIGNKEISIPVLPQKLEITSPGKNEKATVIEMGEVLLLRKKGLRSIAWKSFFPKASAPYVTGRITTPIDAAKAIQAARDAEKPKPIRFLLAGTDLDVNTTMGIDFFDYDARFGELGDIYYEIQLTEWKDYSPKRIMLPGTAEEPALEQEPERPGEPEIAEEKTYSVVSGDSLWAIAQRHYGDGNRYLEIYAANQAEIDGRNRSGNSKYTIYPGQVFTIP